MVDDYNVITPRGETTLQAWVRDAIKSDCSFDNHGHNYNDDSDEDSDDSDSDDDDDDECINLVTSSAKSSTSNLNDAASQHALLVEIRKFLRNARFDEVAAFVADPVAFWKTVDTEEVRAQKRKMAAEMADLHAKMQAMRNAMRSIGRKPVS